jgi:hypothetical protein
VTKVWIGLGYMDLDLVELDALTPYLDLIVPSTNEG